MRGRVAQLIDSVHSGRRSAKTDDVALTLTVRNDLPRYDDADGEIVRLNAGGPSKIDLP